MRDNHANSKVRRRTTHALGLGPLMSTSISTLQTDPTIGFARRLGVMVYDGVLLLSLLLIATGMVLLVTSGAPIAPGNPWFSAYLMAIVYLYFVWPWVHGGQTLGMKTWCVRLRRVGGSGIGWSRASLRFFAAIGSWLLAGLGFLWSLIDRDGLALHDRVSGTVLCKPEGTSSADPMH